jgi:hypothetical protein
MTGNSIRDAVRAIHFAFACGQSSKGSYGFLNSASSSEAARQTRKVVLTFGGLIQNIVTDFDIRLDLL